MAELEKLPYGYTSFRKIRNNKKLYVDKTDIVYRLAHGNMYNFLSRPRRFGKSILVDTLECYWRGERELFEGLKIMELEEDWDSWPVLRLDMSECQKTHSDAIDYLDLCLRRYEEPLGIAGQIRRENVGLRFGTLIETWAQAAEKEVVLLVDEYDHLLQDTWGTTEYEACSSLYRNFFGFVKSKGAHLKWVFLTGIARFSGVALFSGMNNVANISLRADYAELCGFSEADVRGQLWPALSERAEQLNLTPEALYQQYKCDFDGYRFSPSAQGHVYNSYCLIGAMTDNDVSNPLSDCGSSNFLHRFVQADRLNVPKLDHVRVPRDIIEAADIMDGAPELYFYLLGYLTLEASDEECHTLTFPSALVRDTLYKVVVPELLCLDSLEIRTTQQRMVSYLRQGDVEAAMENLSALVERAPFDNNDKRAYKHEAHYQLILQSIFGGCGVLAHLEYLTHQGRADVVVDLGAVVYVLELKMDDTKSGGLDAAEKQLLKRGYHRALKEHGRRVRAVALAFDHQQGGLAEWREVLF